MSLISDIDIANQALSRVGQNTITSFGDNASLTQAIYNQERNTLLRKYPWNFARKWVSLPQLQSAPLSLDIGPNSAAPGSIAMTGAYQLPNDCLRVYRFSPNTAHWRIVGRQIYTDAVPSTNLGALLGLQPIGSDGPDNQPSSPTNTIVSTLGIEYIYEVTDPTQFDALFTDLFIWKLAKDLAFGVSGLLEVYKLAVKEYEDAEAEASAVNGIENWPDEFYNTTLNDVRYGYSNLSMYGG